MARISGINLQDNKRVEISLTAIYGIGRSRSNVILQEAGIDPNTAVKDLSEGEVTRIREIIDREGEVEGDLRKRVRGDISRLKEIGCYRGIRHRRGLPVRGQRSRTNARTRKGPRRRISTKKKKM